MKGTIQNIDFRSQTHPQIEEFLIDSTLQEAPQNEILNFVKKLFCKKLNDVSEIEDQQVISIQTT